jgi:AcrR family transcriptional regulator
VKDRPAPKKRLVTTGEEAAASDGAGAGDTVAVSAKGGAEPSKSGGKAGVGGAKRRSNGVRRPTEIAAEPSERVRMSPQDRRRQILEKAVDFFSEYGLTAQTRGLAAACGISQRLLYRYFPTKEALLDEVYRSAIVGPFKAVWFIELSDRRTPLEVRLTRFYGEYFDTVFTKRWLRLFMYSSLADIGMAPSYTSSMILQLLETIVAEAAFEQGVEVPESVDLQHEIGWTLHGGLSHYAIRRHLYEFPEKVDQATITAIHVAQFLGGFRAAVAAVTAARK